MAILTKAPRGTQDFTPEMAHKLQYVESTLMQTAKLYGFGEIRTPIFEHTELFTRSVGDTSDVVQKEMYTFEDKKGRSITLKPEGTAGSVRAAIEHGLLNEALPLKLSYITPCFRYEKQQAGRYRQFHQFGVELFGAAGAAADAEVISLVDEVLEDLGVTDLALEINSIGCPTCRAKYHAALKEYFGSRLEELCPTCRERLDKNPLRILDCKEEHCHELADKAPVVLDYLCDDCRAHFEDLKARLDAMGIRYTVNPHIVRGLDYYTKTVFEFVSTRIGAQGTVCGGGRYDGLFKELGGPDTPAIGFAMGLERLLMVMEASGAKFPPAVGCDIYLVSMGQKASIETTKMARELRAEGFSAESDLMNRSLKAQMKYANKIGAKYTMVLGDNELETRSAQLKNMETGETTPISLDNYLDTFYEHVMNGYYNGIEEAAAQLGAAKE